MRRWRLSSLRARLALWYLLVLGLVLATFGAGVFLVVRQSLLDGVDAALNSRASTVLGQVGVSASGLRYQGGDAPHANAEMAVYLFDRSGRLLHRVAGSSELPPQPAKLGPALRGQERSITVAGTRLYAAGLRDNHGQTYGAIQVIQSLDTIQETQRQLLTVLLLAIPALLLAATLGGVFLAGRALTPIDRITQTAQRIGAGNLRGRLGLAPRDDEVGRLAATFDGMLDRLERAFAQQRQFAADASHELRTPLAVMRSDLDVLRRRPRAVAEHEEFEQRLDEEIARLSALVEDLLTLARADSGQVELEREFVYLDALVDESAGGLRRLAATKGVAVETSLERGVAVIGDPARLRQLVVNIVDNAVKYTPRGGCVRITLAIRNGWPSLEVADTGLGIAPDELPHIFDRFYRADKARGRAEGGTGLGLSIARWCAEAHGGEISVQSRQGSGTTMTVTLPEAVTDERATSGSGWASLRPHPPTSVGRVPPP